MFLLNTCGQNVVNIANDILYQKHVTSLVYILIVSLFVERPPAKLSECIKILEITAIAYKTYITAVIFAALSTKMFIN